MIAAISPDEAAKKKKDYIPDFVIDAINKLLIQNYSNTITLKLETVINAILNHPDRPENFCRQDLFSNNYLDVEQVFIEAGWEVEFEKGDDGNLNYFVFTVPF